MSKYDSQGTESLYKQTPDEMFGASLDGFSWYGLYRAEEAGGGSIVIEDTYGFVSRIDFETSSDLERVWSEVLTEPDYFGFEDSLAIAEGF